MICQVLKFVLKIQYCFKIYAWSFEFLYGKELDAFNSIFLLFTDEFLSNVIKNRFWIRKIYKIFSAIYLEMTKKTTFFLKKKIHSQLRAIQQRPHQHMRLECVEWWNKSAIFAIQLKRYLSVTRYDRHFFRTDNHPHWNGIDVLLFSHFCSFCVVCVK